MTPPAPLTPSDGICTLPLAGRRIAVTRTPEQAGDMQTALEALGAEVHEYPLLELRALTGSQRTPLLQAISRLSDYHWIVFTSANAVRFFYTELQQAGHNLQSVHGQIAAIGPSTANALVTLGLGVDLVPAQHDAEGMLAALLATGIKGCRVAIPRATVARDILPEGLLQAGATVDVVPIYETVPNLSGAINLCGALRRREVDTVTFTSASAVKHYAQAAQAEVVSLLNGITIACIGPVTASAVRAIGIHTDVVPESYTVSGLIQALVNESRK